MPTIEIPPHIHDVVFGSRAKAYMAGQGDRAIPPDEDKSNIYADCGASFCIPGSLENTTDVI